MEDQSRGRIQQEVESARVRGRASLSRGPLNMLGSSESAAARMWKEAEAGGESAGCYAGFKEAWKRRGRSPMSAQEQKGNG